MNKYKLIRFYREVKELLGLFLFLFFSLSGLLLMANSVIKHQCNNYQKITGIETKVATLDSCYIKTDEGWQRWDEYKARATASELLTQ